MNSRRPTLLFVVTEDWYFVSHRLPLAIGALRDGFRVIVATRVTNHAQVILEAGCEVHPIQLRRESRAPRHEARCVIELVSLYRRYSPDVVHHVALKPVIYGSLAARVCRVPAVVNALGGLGYTFTGSDWQGYILRRAVRASLRLLLSRPGWRVLLQNSDDQALLVEAGVVSEDRTLIIRGSGVDLGEFRVFPEPPGTPIIVLPARMLWDKGVGEFVEAAQCLSSNGAEARFLLVGGTDLASPTAIPLERLEQWNDSGAIEWLGHKNDMPDVLAASAIVCLPSYYGEGIPKALIEAAACGRPIVTTDMPGCREVVCDGENGFLVPARDPMALTKALLRLLGDPGLRRRMGAQGRLYAEQQFGEGMVVGQTLALYRELLAAQQ